MRLFSKKRTFITNPIQSSSCLFLMLGLNTWNIHDTIHMFSLVKVLEKHFQEKIRKEVLTHSFASEKGPFKSLFSDPQRGHTHLVHILWLRGFSPDFSSCNIIFSPSRVSQCFMSLLAGKYVQGQRNLQFTLRRSNNWRFDGTSMQCRQLERNFFQTVQVFWK